VQQLTGKQRLYFGMGDAEWSVVVDGVTDRPEEVAKHFFAYKKDSKEINGAITKSLYEVTPKLQDAIDGITNFIEKHPIKEPIKVYRGEGHYGIFSGNKTSYGKDLAEELERIAKDFSEAKVDYTYIQKFIYNELRNRVIIQSRFLSTAMDKSCADMYAKVAEWKLDVPTGTKGLQIESYNVERKAEDEFLIQRGSKIQIEDAYFDQYQKIWMLKGIVKQD